jgi:prolyl 4-hydroxylase
MGRIAAVVMSTKAVKIGDPWGNGEKDWLCGSGSSSTVWYKYTDAHISLFFIDSIHSPSSFFVSRTPPHYTNEHTHSETNAAWMEQHCRVSCGLCDPNEIDLGLPQTLGSDSTDQAQVHEVLAKAKEYMKMVAADAFLSKALLLCKNQHEQCAQWAARGECAANAGYMKYSCAPVCGTCDQVTLETRCPPVDPDARKAWGPGSLDDMFVNITTRPEHSIYNPQILSRPPPTAADVDDDASTSMDYKIGPWIVVLDNFLSDEECDRLIELGAVEGYKRSGGVGDKQLDGTFASKEILGRTSMNAWCQNTCYDDPIAKAVMYRISNLTGIPEENSEHLQLLKYDVGQYYETHHDYIAYMVDRPMGVRLLTVFLYLNDVDAGGGTHFPQLNITCMPKKGRALLWPSVDNQHPDEKDHRTEHEALKVEAGIKYGANAWYHQRDYKEPFRTKCQ